ncbi:C40 family peptidase [Hymenobacter chitinivorans]|uniref:NlpC/P60 family protein n=1 Tax=Hymenobacter chitinivorans DSM 11115 TaxID=1121954 RepID=A0A2M9BQT0_9BACT|nr:C40 family peptidase [Hymenobacter chitinivorans]PJJ60262.1 NlpC/P60 family protein [Hymenobacter chitinivorans DSM 11115]
MRYVWLTFLTLVAGLVAFFSWQHLHKQPGRTVAVVSSDVPARAVSDTMPPAAAPSGELPGADRLIDFAMQQLGSPYTYAGTTPTGGFDCSGFLLYVYNHVGIAVPHSTALLINAGRAVPREQARRGDMVIFTGTAQTSTTPGHAGIIISEPGEPLRFIHSSSARRESGVKISQVEGTDYERRFMGIRRVLDGAVVNSPAKSSPPKAAGPAVAPVTPLKPKAPQVASTLVVPAPRVVRRPVKRTKTKTVVKTTHPVPAKVKTKVATARKPAAKPAAKKTTSKKPGTKKPVVHQN